VLSPTQIIIESADSNKNLLGYWSFNEGSGSIAHDFSGNGNDGIITGAQWVNGISGKGLRLIDAGTSVNMLRVPEGLGGNHEFTVSFCVKVDTWPPSNNPDFFSYIVYFGSPDYDRAFHVLLNGDIYGVGPGTIRANFWHREIPTSHSFTTDVWYNWVFVYDKTQIKMYQNGTFLENIGLGGAVPNIDPLGIMKISTGGSQYYNGVIDELKIYDYVRTPQQISDDFNELAAQGTAATVSWRDDLNWQSKQEMTSNGWQFDNQQMVTVENGYLTIDNDGATAGGASFNNQFSSGIQEFRVETRAIWTARSYGAPHLKVTTTNHEYIWMGDGYTNQYVLLRDGSEILRTGGYTIQLNTPQTFTIEKTGNTLKFYQDGSLKYTFLETDVRIDNLIGVSLLSHWSGTMKYDYVSVSAPNQNVLYYDNFESYTTGTFPTTAGWILSAEGRGSSYQTITDTTSYSPSNSFQLWGTSGTSAIVDKLISSTGRYLGYEAYIKVQSNTGTENLVGQMGFVDGRYAYPIATVHFDEDGNIYTYDRHITGSGISLGHYEANQWYHVKTVIDKDTSTYSVWINGELRIESRPVEISSSINIIRLESGHAGVKTYFDNLILFEYNA
jgi:hypothetical protein